MITSTGNSQIKNVMNLIKKSKDRKAQGLFVVEGRRMFEETPADRIARVYAAESFARINPEVFKKPGLGEVELVTDEVFAHMSDTKTPQGVLALVKMKEYSVEEMLDKEAPFLLLLENLQDPGNLGTLLRTAEGAGADGVLLSPKTVDIYNPKVIRSTMGAMYRVKYAYVDSLAQTMELLHARGITTYAAHLEGAVDYVEPDYRRGTAFLIGNEGNGLTPEITALAAQRIIIPMKGELESLNAAVSGAILMYEAARQRRI